jgi:hypothetical protein
MAITAERQRMTEALRGLEWLTPLPSETNFVLCRVGGGRDAKTVKQAIEKQGVLVRYFDKDGLRDCLRISVGKPEHTDAPAGLSQIGVRQETARDARPYETSLLRPSPPSHAHSPSQPAGLQSTPKASSTLPGIADEAAVPRVEVEHSARDDRRRALEAAAESPFTLFTVWNSRLLS